MTEHIKHAGGRPPLPQAAKRQNWNITLSATERAAIAAAAARAGKLPRVWARTQLLKGAKEMDKMERVTEWQKTVLIEDLVRDGWTPSAAAQAADDPDNWQEMTDDTVQPLVIASSDQYDE